MPENSILTINGGSSSIKFALFNAGELLVDELHGEVQGIGSHAKLVYNDATSVQKVLANIQVVDFDSATNFLLDWLEKQNIFASLKVTGHRVVHGMHHTGPEKITDELLHELKAISVFDPDHLPGEIKLIEAFKKKLPGVVQIACFDTAFHTTMPPVAKLLPIPRKYYNQGIQRYGFHGLSYAYLLEDLEHVAGREAAHGKLIFAHLGNGASLAALKDGKCIDTSMGFTPASGVPMSSRTGDLDPGVLVYLAQHEKLSATQLNHLINHESGLLGVSETSADMQDLLKSQHTDNRAAEAVELFCYQTKKWIGSFAAALGGLDTLVFSGGIGEHSPEIRHSVCDNLRFLGLELDEVKNKQNAPIISSDGSKVTVHVIPTNEELMIAKLICRLMNYGVKY
jgi:acetate kinase